MEFKHAIDAMETMVMILGLISLAIGLGLGVVQLRLPPVIVGIILAASLTYFPEVMKGVAGIDEPTEQVQMLDDRKEMEKGVDTEAQSDGLMKLLSWLIGSLIVLLVLKKVFTDISAQAEAEYEIERNQNQSPSSPEEIVLSDVRPQDERYTTPKSVGSLKSTRKIQLD